MSKILNWTLYFVVESFLGHFFGVDGVGDDGGGQLNCIRHQSPIFFLITAHFTFSFNFLVYYFVLSLFLNDPSKSESR